MEAKNHRLIFELSKSERERKFKKVLKSVFNLTLELDQPIVFKNNLCIKRNYFIHQYHDGRKYLIEQSQKDSSETVLKKLA